MNRNPAPFKEWRQHMHANYPAVDAHVTSMTEDEVKEACEYYGVKPRKGHLGQKDRRYMLKLAISRCGLKRMQTGLRYTWLVAA